MSYRIQRTIIHKYLKLVESKNANELELIELLNDIKALYASGSLIASDIFRNKLDYIQVKLDKDIEVLKRKRVNKSISIELPVDVKVALESDVDHVAYGNTDLEELGQFESCKPLAIGLDNVSDVLSNILLFRRKLSSEGDLEKYLLAQLALIFGKEKVSSQYSVGGFLALKTDLDIGNGLVGVELKIAENLSASEMQRLIGQVVYYKKRYYENNLIVFIAGRGVLTSSLNELIEFLNELGAKVIYYHALRD